MAKPSNENDVAFVQAMAEILRAGDLAELEVERGTKEEGRLTLRLSKYARPAAPAAVAAPAAPAQTTASAPAPAASAAEATTPAGDPADLPGAVTSPMVGTVYLASEPGAAAFVQKGDTVTEGQTLLIIEAMKTMNQIPAPRAGKVTRILVEDATPVEYGAPLMVIE